MHNTTIFLNASLPGLTGISDFSLETLHFKRLPLHLKCGFLPLRGTRYSPLRGILVLVQGIRQGILFIFTYFVVAGWTELCADPGV